MTSKPLTTYSFFIVGNIHKIYNFNHFKLDSSVALGAFTMLYYHHYPFPEIFHHPKQKLGTHPVNLSSHPPSPSIPVTSTLILGISYKYVICDL